MLNFLITYDNIDVSLGDYFKGCYSDIDDHLNGIDKKNIVALDGKLCTLTEIEKGISTFRANQFIFIGFSHGKSDALVASHVDYVNFNNAYQFQNSFFYTCSCLSAVSLGPELERNGCLAYIGYNEEVKLVIRFEDTFRKCKNSGIKFFVSGDKTIAETEKFMLETYAKEVELLSESSFDTFVAAALLRSNMTALVCLGNKNLTLTDLIYNE